jgi:MFS family permease
MIAILVLHASPFEVGVLTAAAWVPYLGALIIGSWVDRLPIKRPVLVIMDLTRATALVSIPLAFVLHRLTVGQLLLVAIAVGLSGVISQTAYMSFFAQLVKTDDVVAANSLNSTARSGTSLAGPPAAGWLIQAVGAPVAILVDCASFLVSAVMLAGLRVEKPQAAQPRRHVLREAAEGMRTLLRDRWLSSILWCTSVMNLANFAIAAVVLVFATGGLHLSPAAVGTAQGIGAVGALGGALLAVRLSDRLGLFRVVLIGCVLFSLPFLGVGLTSAGLPTTVKIGWLGGCLLLVSGGIMLYDIMINSVMIKVMPEDMRGRMIGAFSSINYGIRPLGALLGGTAGELWGPRVTILVAAGLGLLAVIPLLRSPLRPVRKLADVQAAPVLP